MTDTNTDNTLVTQKQLLSTITSLYAYIQHTESQPTAKQQLIDATNNTVYIQCVLNVLPKKISHLPHKLPIKHALYNTNTDDICLIVKDGTKSDVQTAIDSFKTQKVSKVLEFTELKKHYNTDKLKRELCTTYALFLIDNRLVNIIKPVIGKHFLSRKKQPIPIAMDRSLNALEHHIEQALNHTYMFISQGTTVQIKAGLTSMSRYELAENIQSIISHIHQYIPTKSNNAIQALYLKTSDSAALPLYAKLPENTTTDKTEKVKKLTPVDIIDSRLNKITRIMKRKYRDNAVLPLVERNKTYLNDEDVYEMLVSELDENTVVPVKKHKNDKPVKADTTITTESVKTAVKPVKKASSEKSVAAGADNATTDVKKQKGINQPKSKDTRQWLKSKTR